jgi:DNA mismatch endonuclease (patch repair protein)
MMSAIRGKNTKPEVLIRKSLFARGFRYRLHSSRLPGKPDLVFPKYRAVILINGCFWHRHECHLFKWPSSRPDFWRKKLEGNYSRDQRNIKLLHDLGWRTLVIWECAIKGKQRLPVEALTDQIAYWLTADCPSTSIPDAN